MTEDYLKLESLIQKVVSPYLGTYGLYSSDGPFTHSACILGKNNTDSIWHSTEDFPKPCSMQGQGPHEVTASAHMSTSGFFSKTMLFARCRITVKLGIAKDENGSL